MCLSLIFALQALGTAPRDINELLVSCGSRWASVTEVGPTVPRLFSLTSLRTAARSFSWTKQRSNKSGTISRAEWTVRAERAASGVQAGPVVLFRPPQTFQEVTSALNGKWHKVSLHPAIATQRSRVESCSTGHLHTSEFTAHST